jgi:hypothetical protein
VDYQEKAPNEEYQQQKVDKVKKSKSKEETKRIIRKREKKPYDYKTNIK